MAEKTPTIKDSSSQVKKSLRYMRDKDRELVRGIFRFHEVSGGELSFRYKAYKEDPLEKHTFLDGETYTIPLGIARHLNNNCCYPIHRYTQDENGKVSAKIGQKVQRCTFQSLEFVDIEGLEPAPDIITVEKVI